MGRRKLGTTWRPSGPQLITGAAAQTDVRPGDCVEVEFVPDHGTGTRERIWVAVESVQAGMIEGKVTLAVPEGALVVPRLFTELGVGIQSVTVTRPSLDDVFLTYTGRTIRDSEGPQAPMFPFAGRR